MKKLVYIFGLFTVLAVLASCEKEMVKPVFSEDYCESSNNRGSSEKEGGELTSLNIGGEDGDDLNTGGGITDPNNDEDYDGINDSETDTDKQGKGK